MCGIAGLIGFEYPENKISKIIREIQSSLNHRGPNWKGFWTSKEDKISLIHTRLSILDLSKDGNQPMNSSCGRYIIVFNGEIYNHLNLRRMLKSHKHNIKWKSTSDTETLLECVSAIGVNKTIPYLRGMFAFSLFDKKNKKIYLIRDRYGENLYIYLTLKMVNLLSLLILHPLHLFQNFLQT